MHLANKERAIQTDRQKQSERPKGGQIVRKSEMINN